MTIKGLMTITSHIHFEETTQTLKVSVFNYPFLHTGHIFWQILHMSANILNKILKELSITG